MSPSVTVVVLAGGTARRFGSDKLAAVLPDGRSVLDHCLAGMPPVWPLVVVGPERPVPSEVADRVRFVREAPAGGGPLAGIAAGVEVADGDVVCVAPGDTPRTGEVLPLLVGALDDNPAVDAAVLSDAAGQRNPVLAAYRTSALRAALPDVPAGGAARELLTLHHVEVRAPFDVRDITTPADITDIGMG